MSHTYTQADTCTYTYIKIKIKRFNLKKKKKKELSIRARHGSTHHILSSWKVKAKTCEFKVILTYRDKFGASLGHVRP